MAVGFVDLQVNGWMGTDFTAPGLSVERVLEITRELVSRGTQAYCPTVVTGDPDVYQVNFETLRAAMADSTLGSHILGIHLEGPFISPEPGAVGAHPKPFVLDPDIKAFDQFQEWADGMIRILTVAPERPGCLELIRHAAESGVVVSVGHHMANDDELKAAVDAGVTLCTHVGNGLPNQIDRHHNSLWWELASDDTTGMFITDGHHLPAPLIKVALRAKTVARFIVTSDASPLAGMPPGNYTMFSDLPVKIDATGRIYSERSHSLAGSHATMIECMNHLAVLGIASEEELWRVGRHNPLQCLGLTEEALSGVTVPDVSFDGTRFTVAAG